MTMSTNITDALHFVSIPAKYSTSICRTALFKSSSIRGAELVGEVVQYENVYRLCYIRGAEGLLIGLAEQLGNQTATDILENSCLETILKLQKQTPFTMFNKIDQYYHEAKANKWYHYFAIFCRVVLAVAWIISGGVKISGERFAAGLSHNHPLGQYFDALLNTGYYYTFIGVGQVIVAILLLIPRTAIIGAISSFPIILNICVLTYSVRFEGTRIATFMLLANLFLLCWHYDRLKFLLPDVSSTKVKSLNSKFPFLFLGTVVAMLAAVVFLNNIIYDIRPGNEPAECWNGCPGNSNPKACEEFCDCIHNQGKPLGTCLAAYEKAKKKRNSAYGPGYGH
jgi:hypothetical protein